MRTKKNTIRAPKNFQLKKEEADKLRHSGEGKYVEKTYSHEDCTAKVKEKDGYIIVSYRDRVEGMYIPDKISRYKVGDIVRIRERFCIGEYGKKQMLSECPEDDRENHKWGVTACKATEATMKGNIVDIVLVGEEGGKGLTFEYTLKKVS